MAKAKAKQKQPDEAANDLWSKESILDFAPDEASIPAAEKVLKKGGFGKVEATADGKGWWVVCRGITGTYQTSARIDDAVFNCECTCPSSKYPCKHALALLLYLRDHPELRVEPEEPKYAATDFEALLRAVFQNPDDDTLRLVFADFLEENDQSDRAALIRLQIEKARHKAKSDRGKELAKEEKELLAKVRTAVEPLPEGMRAAFRRGFLHLTANLFSFTNIGAFPERFTRLFRDGWVETVHFEGYMFDLLSEEHATLLGLAAELDFSLQLMVEDALVALVAHVAEMKATGRMCRVKVHRNNQKAFDQLTAAQAGGEVVGRAGRLEALRQFDGLTRQTLELLIRAGRLRSARHLHLYGRLGDSAAEQLAAAGLSGVEQLYLGQWQLGPDGIAALTDAPWFAGLTGFGVSDSTLTPASLGVLARGTSPTRLERLFLIATRMTDAGLAELAKATRFRSLKELLLDRNNLTAAGLAGFLRSPNFPALVSLSVTRNDIEYPELLPLLLGAAERPELALTFNGLTLRRWCGKDGVRFGIDIPTQLRAELFGGLAGVAAATQVTALRVFRAEITSKGLKALAKAFDPAALKHFEFRDLAMKNEGAEQFATAFAGYKLETLRLPVCRIQASGTAALANSPLLASVKVLDLSGNGIGKAGAEALAKSPYLGNLTRLELTDWRVGKAEQKLLKAKFGKKLVL